MPQLAPLSARESGTAAGAVAPLASHLGHAVEDRPPQNAERTQRIRLQKLGEALRLTAEVAERVVDRSGGFCDWLAREAVPPKERNRVTMLSLGPAYLAELVVGMWPPSVLRLTDSVGQGP